MKALDEWRGGHFPIPGHGDILYRHEEDDDGAVYRAIQCSECLKSIAVLAIHTSAVSYETLLRYMPHCKE